MKKVEIYTTALCPYCKMAKNLLAKRRLKYEEFSVDRVRGSRSEMIERSTGRTTVPQVSIDGKHIGGFDELTELDMDGELSAST